MTSHADAFLPQFSPTLSLHCCCWVCLGPEGGHPHSPLPCRPISGLQQRSEASSATLYFQQGRLNLKSRAKPYSLKLNEEESFSSLPIPQPHLLTRTPRSFRVFPEPLVMNYMTHPNLPTPLPHTAPPYSGFCLLGMNISHILKGTA